MAEDEETTIDERCKYLRKMEKIYKKAKRQERVRLLDEMEEVTNLHRKSLIQLMRLPPRRKRRSKARKPRRQVGGYHLSPGGYHLFLFTNPSPTAFHFNPHFLRHQRPVMMTFSDYCIIIKRIGTL